MPGALTSKPDTYLCTNYRVLYPGYLVNFEVHASMDVAHHVLLYGCNRPILANLPYGPCNEICGDGNPKIIFAWARNASSFSYPPDVGFKIGTSDSNVHYLVFQVHYLNPVKKKDFTSITLKYATEPPRFQAGMYLFVGYAQPIPPKKTAAHVDVACIVNQKQEIYPFAFRTHAHAYGRAISAYVLKPHSNNTSTHDDMDEKENLTYDPNIYTEWIRIGIGSPQWPQAFYPTTKDIVIRIKDVLIARCTYDSMEANQTIYIGGSHNDEMCNFYMMYYFEPAILPSSAQLQGGDEDMNMSRAPHHIAASQTCLDYNFARDANGKMIDNPFSHSPFETDPVDLLGISGGAAHGMSGTQHTLSENGDHIKPKPIITANLSYFENLSLLANTKWTKQATQMEDINFMTPHKHHTLSKGFGKNWKTINMTYDSEWPRLTSPIGQIGGLATYTNGENNTFIFVFQRGPNVWNESTFNTDFTYREKDTSPITQDTILVFKGNGKNGKLIASFGANMFYLPHGITVDNQANVWVTDVAQHQVMKLSPWKLGAEDPKIVLKLGVQFEPGSDSKHFCQPAAIVVSSVTQELFVADGYCNRRIVKFSSTGEYLTQFDAAPSLANRSTLQLNVPHSLALVTVPIDEETSADRLLFIADRENGRIMCLDIQSQALKTESSVKLHVKCPSLFIPTVQRGSIYAVTYVSLLNTKFAKTKDTYRLLGILIALRSDSISFMLEPLRSPALLFFPVIGHTEKLLEESPYDFIENKINPMAIVPLIRNDSEPLVFYPHDMTSYYDTLTDEIFIYLGGLRPNTQNLWKFILTPDNLDLEPGVMEIKHIGITDNEIVKKTDALDNFHKKPSVKKAGVPTTNDKIDSSFDNSNINTGNEISTKTVTGKGMDTFDGTRKTNYGIDDNEDSDKNITMPHTTLSKLKHSSQKLNNSTVIIVFALSIPVSVTLAILFIMRKQATKRKREPKFATFANDDDEEYQNINGNGQKAMYDNGVDNYHIAHKRNNVKGEGFMRFFNIGHTLHGFANQVMGGKLRQGHNLVPNRFQYNRLNSFNSNGSSKHKNVEYTLVTKHTNSKKGTKPKTGLNAYYYNDSDDETDTSSLDSLIVNDNGKTKIINNEHEDVGEDSVLDLKDYYTMHKNQNGINNANSHNNKISKSGTTKISGHSESTQHNKQNLSPLQTKSNKSPQLPGTTLGVHNTTNFGFNNIGNDSEPNILDFNNNNRRTTIDKEQIYHQTNGTNGHDVEIEFKNLTNSEHNISGGINGIETSSVDSIKKLKHYIQAQSDSVNGNLERNHNN